jgi:hypothetical protein
MAELLIKASPHWMDKLSYEEVIDKRAYNSRVCIGDIIVVRPDGWKWGKCECLPDFIVVKVPGTQLDNEHLEESLFDEKGEMLKQRKSSITEQTVSDIALLVKDLKEITPVNLTTAISEKVR